LAVFFISDLHLSASRPEIIASFSNSSGSSTQGGIDLHSGRPVRVLGGDDDLGEPFNASVVAALAECSRAGPSLRIMHGNRDFLLGADFAAACNAA